MAEEVAAAASVRSGMYALLSLAFAFPQPSFHAEVIDGRWREGLGRLAAALPYRLTVPAAWRAPSDYERFQSEYIRLFEVGPRGGAPCPLHGGHYARDRLRTLEELVRFYRFFGLRHSQGLMPDHITVELEFMHFLASKEEAAERAGEDGKSHYRAQRDFLQRQLANWWPLVVAAVRRERATPFYRSLVALAGRFLEAEQRYLDAAL